MINNSRHTSSMAMIVMLNLLAAFGALKTLEVKLHEESQKAYNNAPKPPQNEVVTTYATAMDNTGGAYVAALSNHRSQVLSE